VSVWSDVNHLVRAILLVIGAVLPVINPLGDAPLFLQMTDDLDQETRSGLAARVATYSFGLLLGSMLLGSFVLRLFDLSLAVVQVGGGAVVSALGWKLLNQDDAPRAPVAHRKPDALARALYPLTLPLTVDPGVISVAITVGVSHADNINSVVVKLVAAVIGSALIALIVLLTYRSAWRLSSLVGQQWMGIVVRLSAFIVLCIGVQIVWNGMQALAAEMRSRASAPLAAAARLVERSG
jgi:multiple antibiotic resistance protein